MIWLDGGQRQFQILRHGAVVGSLQPPTWLSSGAMWIGPQGWTLGRSGREYVATGDQTRLVAMRRRPSVHWDAHGTGAPYLVQRAGGFGLHWSVLRWGIEIGRSWTHGRWRPNAAIAFPDDVPPPDQVFLLWLVQDGIHLGVDRRCRRCRCVGSGDLGVDRLDVAGAARTWICARTAGPRGSRPTVRAQNRWAGASRPDRALARH